MLLSKLKEKSSGMRGYRRERARWLSSYRISRAEVGGADSEFLLVSASLVAGVVNGDDVMHELREDGDPAS